MKRNVILGMLASTAIFMSCSHDKVTASYQVIPLPQEITAKDGNGAFALTDRTVITYPSGNEALKSNAELLAGYISQLTGHKLKVTDTPSDENAIVLLDNLDASSPEAYTLDVTPTLITINGTTAAGNFYGIQTLRKSIPEKGDHDVEFPAVNISDSPRFAYRGAMLDVSRHFFPVDSVKKFIDMLALHNINRFHWHLSEDQGWRIEIKSRPRLAEIASKRKGTCVGHDFSTSDSIPYGGFYTQDEAREIVKYASDRHITVIPEIDMPGHMVAALSAYPELGCTGGPYEVWQRWGVSEDLLCAGNDKAYEFIDDVLSEIVDIFPSEYIHVGGDECPKVRWENCPKCQAKIRELRLKDDAKGSAEQKLQSHFMHHASDFLTSRGRKMIGWDETLEGGLAPGAIVMSWRGEEGAKEAARQGHDAIMTPTGYMYFDYYQTLDREGEPDAIGGYVPVEKVYSFNPTPDDMTDEEKKHILGVQANLWTEYIPEYSQVEYMELPRMAALAEVQWTDPSKKDYKNFTHRVPQLAEHYKANGYRYATHIFNVNGTLTPNPETGTIDAVFSTVDDAPVYYTLDGSEPNVSSTLYEKPVQLTQSGTIKAVAIRKGGASKIFADSVTFNKATGRAITMSQEPHSRYRAEGATTLVNGKYGTTAFTAGGWLGFNGSDLDAVVDLGSQVDVKNVAVRTLVDHPNWILDAESIEVGVSEDGKKYTTMASEKYSPDPQNTPSEIRIHNFDFSPVKARYVKIVAKSVKQMPSWEGRARIGDPAFMFVDEIIVD